MNAWLDANADGLALMFWVGLIGCLFLVLAWIGERRHARRNRRFPNVISIDRRRCERAGSQDEFARRLRAGGTR